MTREEPLNVVDWQPEGLEVKWSDELILAIVADAALHPKASPSEGLAPTLSYLMLRLGLPNDTRFLNRIGDSNGGLPALDKRIYEQLWRLVLRGVLVPAGDRFEVTEAGLVALSDMEGDARVSLVADGLRRALEERSPQIDPVALRYAELAQDCFFSGHHEGSVMLLGAASEIIVTDLIDALNEKASTIGIDQIEGRNARERLEALRETIARELRQLKAAIVSAGGDGNWLNDLPGLLDSANAIRLTRNDTGHPSRILPRRYEAQGALVMFPHLTEALVQTTEEVRRL